MLKVKRGRVLSVRASSDLSCLIQPLCVLGGFARVYVCHFMAFLAADDTAPVKLTFTLGHPHDAGGVIASATAHHFTAVHPTGGPVAHSACCTQRPCFSVYHTVVWRALKIHQVILCWFFKVLICYCKPSAILVHDHLDCAVVFSPEVVASFFGSLPWQASRFAMYMIH